MVKDLGVDSGVEEGAEEHVTGDAGEAVEVGDTHGGYCFMRRGTAGVIAEAGSTSFMLPERYPCVSRVM